MCFSLCNYPLWLNNPKPFAVPPAARNFFLNFAAASATVEVKIGGAGQIAGGAGDEQ
jgi:hypothetical protein